MIKLSDRLQYLADYVERDETVADIGTDHGYLPIYLIQNHIANKVIMIDVNQGPLDTARRNIHDHFQDIEMPMIPLDLRLGNGLDPLKDYEVDSVIIAGMGGLLISQILGTNLKKTKTIKKLILQPRNAQDKLRIWLSEFGFEIISEKLVKEGIYICEIIVAVPKTSYAPCNVPTADDCSLPFASAADDCSLPFVCATDDWSLPFEISPLLFESRDPLLFAFIENKLNVENKIFKGLMLSKSDDKEEKTLESKKRIEILNMLKDKVKKSCMI